jgi:hypothetical protein
MKTLVMIAALAAACSKPAGGPLKYTFDDTRIATVPLDKKQTVTQAQQQHDVARAEHNDASESYRDSDVEVELAVYQLDHAVLVSQLVATRRGNLTTNADTAALARKAAAAKLAFSEARRSWLAQLESSTFYGVYAAQAKLELERAKVAQSNNVVPAGYDLSLLERQVEDRAKAAQTADAATQAAHQDAELKLAAWVEAEHAFLAASGFKGSGESDRAQELWKKPPAPPAPAEQPAPAPPTMPAAPSPST